MSLPRAATIPRLIESFFRGHLERVRGSAG